MLFSFVLKRVLLGLFLTAVGGVLPLLMAQTAKAQTSSQTGNINIQAQVIRACRITSTQDINFGDYDPLFNHATAPLNATGQISVKCLPNITASIRLGQGNNAATGSSCTAPKRRMANGPSAHLPYGLYKDSGATQVWGCDNTNEVQYTANNAASQSFTIYGQIPAASNLPAGTLDQLIPGNYSDTVQVTVLF